MRKLKENKSFGSRGVRTRKERVDDFTRERIKVTQIVKRLYSHMVGEVEMLPTQVKAAEILLRKCLPDLSATAFTGQVTHTYAEVPQVLDESAWLKHRGIVNDARDPDRTLN